MKSLTIFTPTYNRAYIIERLYRSLVEQNNKDFIWLIVDDGSTDNTKSLVEQWILQNEVEIKYIYQNNAGKHIAHNTGVENCTTELFLCVDSDDYLLANAVECILNNKSNINQDNISGMVSSRIDKNKKVIGTKMVNSIKSSSLSDLYEKHRFKGDTALVFKTNILKKYKFPRIEGEKFVGEEYIYCQIDAVYKLYLQQDEYYVCEYLEDGYTNNIFKLIANNPKGYMELKKIKLTLTENILSAYKAAALYIVGGYLSKEKHILKNSPKKIFTFFAIPLAKIIYYSRFSKINKDEQT